MQWLVESGEWRVISGVLGTLLNYWNYRVQESVAQTPANTRGVMGPSTAPLPSWLFRRTVLSNRFDDSRDRRAVGR